MGRYIAAVIELEEFCITDYTGSSGHARSTRADSTHVHYKNDRIYSKAPSNTINGDFET